MIQLHSQSLIFELANGDTIPCSAEQVTIDLIGDAADALDPEVIRQASAAVLHYFKVEQNRDFVSVQEFASALTRVLRGFGFNVVSSEPGKPAKQPEAVSDLRRIACESGKGYELIFFSRLRDEMRRRLGEPESRIVRFHGLRGCVKQLAGARRWSRRCQRLNDQIVEYLRGCLGLEESDNRTLLVQ